MDEVKFCKNCIWSTQDKTCAHVLRCKNPKVNAKDNWALSCSDYNGTSCTTERSLKWLGVCGMSGKQWEKHSGI